ncbi:MAG: Myo-inositol 2-dehydrogenase [Candidatus Ruthia sp. Asou_11_S2]|nr:Myo-inositol 2-dehydrogenase [Candidatus Ruthia sp. Asou_11_S2]
MLNICLIGAGRIGVVHAHAIATQQQAVLHSVVDFVPKVAQQLASQYKAKSLTLDEAFDDNAIDAYVIASSTSTHSDLIERCAKVNKPVFCEKPIDLDINRATACAEIVKASGITCMIGFNRRFDPHMASLKSKIDDNLIGSIQSLLINSRDPEPPVLDYIATSGGLFYDMMIHDFDMACWLLNEKPSSVYVAASVVDKGIASCGDVDTASVILTTQSGAIATIINGRQAAFGYDQRVEVFGENGMLQVQNVLEDNVVLSNAQGVSQAKAKNFFMQRYTKAFHNELIHFITSIQLGVKPSVSIEDGLLAMQIAEASMASLQSGKVVHL